MAKYKKVEKYQTYTYSLFMEKIVTFKECTCCEAACCIFQPAFGCCTLQTLVEICFFKHFLYNSRYSTHYLPQTLISLPALFPTPTINVIISFVQLSWTWGDMIPLDWLNNSFETYKIKMKNLFLTLWIFFYIGVILYPLSTMTLWRNYCLNPIHQYWVRSECHEWLPFSVCS